MLMRISEGQKKTDKIYRSRNFLSGVLMKCEMRGGWGIQGFKITLMRNLKDKGPVGGKW